MLRFLIVAVSLALSAAFGQEFRATLAGRVTDTVGAAVAGASIRVRNTGTGESAATTSGEDGSYQVSFLTPGDYVVTIEKAGFNRSIREGVHLDVAQRAVADVQLAVGDVTQSVTVSAGAEILETESADRGLTIESARVLNTPLQGRNIFAQAWSAPGVVVNAGAQRLRPFDIAGS